MYGFVTSPRFGIVVRGNSAQSRCVLNARNWIIVPTTKSFATMQTTNAKANDELEDDDATLGSSNYSGDGPKTPPMTPSEMIYLDSAETSKEYMKRMAEIAETYDRERDGRRARGEIQSPEGYMDSLGVRGGEEPEGDFGGPRMAASDLYMENLSRSYRRERGIDEPPLSENIRLASELPGPPAVSLDTASDDDDNPEEEDCDGKQPTVQEEVERLRPELEKLRTKPGTYDHLSLEEQAKLLEDTQRDIRMELGLKNSEEPEAQEENIEAPIATQEAVAAQNPGTVNKQIQYLERYLERLQTEAVKDTDAAEYEGNTTEDIVDDEEFERQRQAMLSEIAEELGKMPNARKDIEEIESLKRTKPQPPQQNSVKTQETTTDSPQFQGLENAPGEMSAEEKMAAFEQLRKQAMQSRPSSEFADPFNVTLPDRKEGSMDDEDVPSPESESEYDTLGGEVRDKNLLLEEIESEIKAYVRDSKNLLQKHETRLNVLLTRLQIL